MSAVPLDELVGKIDEVAEQLRTVPGLVSKAWIRDGTTLGGFYVFENRALASDHLERELAELRSAPIFDHVQVRHFDVLDGPSLVDGTPAEALVRRPAGPAP